jgi:threonine/homoserine/homoserine lactone efflux protein
MATIQIGLGHVAAFLVGVLLAAGYGSLAIQMQSDGAYYIASLAGAAGLALIGLSIYMAMKGGRKNVDRDVAK